MDALLGLARVSFQALDVERAMSLRSRWCGWTTLLTEEFVEYPFYYMKVRTVRFAGETSTCFLPREIAAIAAQTVTVGLARAHTSIPESALTSQRLLPVWLHQLDQPKKVGRCLGRVGLKHDEFQLHKLESWML